MSYEAQMETINEICWEFEKGRLDVKEVGVQDASDEYMTQNMCILKMKTTAEYKGYSGTHHRAFHKQYLYDEETIKVLLETMAAQCYLAFQQMIVSGSLEKMIKEAEEQLAREEAEESGEQGEFNPDVHDRDLPWIPDPTDPTDA